MKKDGLQKARGNSSKQLITMLKKRKSEMILASSQMGAGKLKNLKKVKGLKREITQILTIIKEKEIMKTKEALTAGSEDTK